MDLFEIKGEKKSGFNFSATVILYVIPSIVIQGLFGTIMPTDGVWYRVVCSFVSPLAIGAVILYNSFSEKRSILSICAVNKFNPLYIIPAVILPIGMLLGLGFVNDAVATLVVKAGLNVQTATVPFDGWWSLIVYIVTIAIMPALFEEGLFRGVMLSGFEKKHGVLSVLCVSICFAIYHGSVAQLIYQFIYGVGLTVLAYKSGSALPSMIAHFINNAVVLALTYFGVVIDFYSPILIILGITLLLGVAVFLAFYDRKPTTEKSDGKGKTALGFWLFALMGTAVTVTIIVSNLLVKV